MVKKKSILVKVCPQCFSTKLNSHLGFSGDGYKCMNCDFDNFFPLEVKQSQVNKLQKKVQNNTKGSVGQKPVSKKKRRKNSLWVVGTILDWVSAFLGMLFK